MKRFRAANVVFRPVADLPLRSLGDWFMPACRVPPRRAGNFLLLAQKKVTKEECLEYKQHALLPLSVGVAVRRATLHRRIRSMHLPARRYGSLRIALEGRSRATAKDGSSSGQVARCNAAVQSGPPDRYAGAQR